MASYTLLASESTVQVLSPTVVNDVVYCTIQTHPSGVIASIPAQADVFNSGQAGVELTNFSNAIEQTMNLAAVVSGVGEQQIDTNGLLADFVSFTVQYKQPGTTDTTVTAEASVPVGYLNFTDGQIGQASWENVQAIVNGVYANLKKTASG